MSRQQGTREGQPGDKELRQWSGVMAGSIEEEKHQGQPDGRLEDGQLLHRERGQVTTIGKGHRGDGPCKTCRRDPRPRATGQVANKEVGKQARQ